jgi:hypothetical protein
MPWALTAEIPAINAATAVSVEIVFIASPPWMKCRMAARPDNRQTEMLFRELAWFWKKVLE